MVLAPSASVREAENFDDVTVDNFATDDLPHEDAAYEDARANMLRELRLFHARIIEGVDAAVETLAHDIASEVLGRELHLAHANIAAIVDRALRRYFADEPLRVRVHPDEAPMLSCALPVVADERLRSGDAVIELRCGSVDATLGVRLAAVMRGIRT
jgi:flagellar biosynthesis/type III secretory pathway protein FliH